MLDIVEYARVQLFIIQNIWYDDNDIFNQHYITNYTSDTTHNNKYVVKLD